jgi:hypothetical protein
LAVSWAVKYKTVNLFFTSQATTLLYKGGIFYDLLKFFGSFNVEWASLGLLVVCAAT